MYALNEAAKSNGKHLDIVIGWCVTQMMRHASVKFADMQHFSDLLQSHDTDHNPFRLFLLAINNCETTGSLQIIPRSFEK